MICLLKRTIPEELAENYDPEERLTMSEALHWYTVGAHALTDMNYRRGKLSPKMDADFTVVDDGFLHAHAEDLSKKLVRATYVAGEQTFLSSKPTQLK